MMPAASPTAGPLRAAMALAGLAGALGVVALALSAHSEASSLLDTAARVLLFHAPLYLGLGLLAQIRRVPLVPVTLLLLSAGLALFCGDLFLRAFAGTRLFPMSAPIGGMLVILAWVSLALGALRVGPK